jgi:tRNA(His) 5'-end guanylyltransferase
MSEVIKKEKEGVSLADRMKKFEDVTRSYLIPKMPVIVRIDGRAFHTYTRQKWCEFPFSHILIHVFHKTVLKVCEETMNVVLAYHQSDEVTFLLKDYDHREQQQLFDGNIQKIVSTFASKFTVHFNRFIEEELMIDRNIPGMDLKPAEFDCRVFNIPIHEVVNCFIWRQLDWERNSLTQYASSFFSHHELMNKNSFQKTEMIQLAGHLSWDSLPNYLKYGTFFRKVEVELPVKELTEEEIKYLDSDFIDPVIRKKWIIDINSPRIIICKDYIEEIVKPEE